MANSSNAAEVFLAELTRVLTASGWARADRDHFAMVTPVFTHPDTTAVLTITITGSAWATPSAFLMHDGSDNCWRVACNNPDPTVLAAAANATLTSGSASHGGGPLRELLQKAGWSSEARWTSPDGTKIVCFPSKAFSAPAWLTCQAETPSGIRLAQYAPTPATPTAVLAALALTPTPTGNDPAQSEPPEASA